MTGFTEPDNFRINRISQWLRVGNDKIAFYVIPAISALKKLLTFVSPPERDLFRSHMYYTQTQRHNEI